MIVFLIENELYSIGESSFTKSLNDKFPRTSTIYMNSRNFESTVDTIKSTRPLLTSKWLLIGFNLNSSYVKNILKYATDEVLVFKYLTKTKELEDLMKELKSKNVKFSIVDNVNISEDRMVSYVCSELDLEEKEAKSLVKRCNNYVPYLNESVFALKSLGRKVERKDILNFVVKRSSFNTLSLFNHLIGFKRVSDDVVARFLYDFRYALKYLKTDLLDKFDDALLIYSLMNDGILSTTNYMDFEYPRKLKISDYLLKLLILDISKSVSYETLLFNKLSIEKIDHFYQLVELCTK